MTDSKKQLSIQFVFGRVTGQEELDPSSKHRAARSPLTPSFSQRGAETPLTPQTGETGGRSRPETGRLGTADRMIRRWERVTVATGHDDLQELHEARKMLQTSKSVRFINTEDETGACGASGREGGVFKNDSKLNERKRGGKKTALSRKRQFHGTRDMRKDMTMQLQATFACCFNPKYNEFWAGIAVHNGDPMTVTDNDAAFGGLIAGYPSALVDRGSDVDPSGMSPEFFNRLQIPPVAVLTNGATWNATTRELNVSVTADFALAANNNYKLACVLTEDGVTGTGSGYNQSNAYAGGGNGAMGGFESLGNPVPAAQMVYDHVARAIAPSFAGYANSFPASVAPGDQHTINFSFVLPATWDENSIHIIGMIIAPDGRIDNAGKATITEAVTTGFQSGSNAGLYDGLSNQLDEMVKIYPNPATSQATISLNLVNESSIQVSVLDAAGKIISAKNYGKMAGNWDLNLNTTHLNAGIYLIQLEINGAMVTKRLIIE
jgi:hypothetical protein